MIGSEDEARTFVAQRCDPGSFAQLERLVGMLALENEQQNLVSAASLGFIWQRHIADSAQLLDHVPRETFDSRSGTRWLDLGTGAGFPGLVIAIMRPGSQVTLVESRRRRAEWLNQVATELEMPATRVEGQRLELVKPFAAHVISARAFAPLDKLVSLAERFSTSDTCWLLPKGRSAAQEVALLPSSLRDMFHVEQSATDEDSGIVVGRIAERQRR